MNEDRVEALERRVRDLEEDLRLVRRLLLDRTIEPAPVDDGPPSAPEPAVPASQMAMSDAEFRRLTGIKERRDEPSPRLAKFVRGAEASPGRRTESKVVYASGTGARLVEKYSRRGWRVVSQGTSPLGQAVFTFERDI